MATVMFDHATHFYPDRANPAVDKLSLSVSDGEFLVLVGPSGCGKTTSLRMLAGLEYVDAGRVFIDGVDVTNTAPKARNIAMVFQNYALYPHMSVADNIGFSLKVKGVPKKERVRQVRHAAELLGLEEHLNDKPKSLSGGQRQRVAMGRAIVRNPQVFLMDEPLSNLDPKLRLQTRTEIISLTRRLGVTTIYVTHDQVEAMTMGDRVAVLNNGVLQQVDTPHRLYHHPDNLFVADFIGSPAMNLFTLPVTNTIQIDGYSMAIPQYITENATSDTITVGIRPTDIAFATTEDVTNIALIVNSIEEFGADVYIHGHTTLTGKKQNIAMRINNDKPPRPGEVIKVRPCPNKLHVFDSKTGQRLSH